MNIQLVYNSNSYKFDIPPNKTVNYLKGLACKIFNLKKEFSELVYRKKNISKECPNLQIKVLFPKNDSEHLINIKSIIPVKEEPALPKPQEINEKTTKYSNEINQLKDKLRQFDFAYQEKIKEIISFKTTIEQVMQNLINVLKVFKENALMIDMLLDNKKDFDAFHFIKGDILNFVLEKDDNDNLKKIDIFNQKIDSYNEKLFKIDFRKKYQTFIIEQLNQKISFIKTFYNELDYIYRNSSKVKYEVEIDNLISKYVNMKESEKEINENQTIPSKKSGIIMSLKKPIQRKETLFNKKASINQNHSRNLSGYESTITNIVNRNNQKKMILLPDENNNKKNEDKTVIVNNSITVPSINITTINPTTNNSPKKSLFINNSEQKLINYKKQISNISTALELNPNDSNNTEHENKRKFLPLILTTHHNRNRLDLPRSLSPHDTAFVLDDDRISQRSKNSNMMKSRCSTFMYNYTKKKKQMTGAKKYDFLI